MSSKGSPQGASIECIRDRCHATVLLTRSHYRGAYCASVVISLLNIPRTLSPSSPARSAGHTNLFDGLPEWIQRCMSGTPRRTAPVFFSHLFHVCSPANSWMTSDMIVDPRSNVRRWRLCCARIRGSRCLRFLRSGMFVNH